MNKVGSAIEGFLSWVYSLKPDTVKHFEIVLIAYGALLLHLNLSPQQQVQYAAIGFGIYGVLRAVQEVILAFQNKE